MNTHTILTLILLTRYWGVSSGTNLGALTTHFLCLGTRTFTPAPFDERNCFVVNKRIVVGSCQKYFLINDCCTRILLNFLSLPYHRKTVIFTRFLSTKKVQKHWGFSNDVYREILIKFIEEGGCCSYEHSGGTPAYQQKKPFKPTL